MRAFIPEVTAVLAVDKSLTYSQISPVITALAAANISKYGFETKIIRE
jgi:biopolymer transport protein ExbD